MEKKSTGADLTLGSCPLRKATLLGLVLSLLVLVGYFFYSTAWAAGEAESILGRANR